MPEFIPKAPYNSRTWSDMLESGPIVPETEDRVTVRLPTQTWKLLGTIEMESDQHSLTKLCSLGLYYAKDSIKRTYDFDWDAFQMWRKEHLEQQGRKWSGPRSTPVYVTYEYQEPLEKYVHVRPKGRDVPWLERMGNLTGLHDQADVLRLLLYYACVLYDWETFAGEKAKWNSWLETPRRAVWELEHVIEDRQDRIESKTG